MDTQTVSSKRQASVDSGEQRLYQRLPGSRMFRLAQYDGRTMPGQHEFQSFEACNYSPDGFSYWSVEKPVAARVVIELPYRNRANYHEAKVMHWTQAQRDGMTCHLVGCRFSKRIEIEA